MPVAVVSVAAVLIAVIPSTVIPSSVIPSGARDLDGRSRIVPGEIPRVRSG
jgi:hypothetical protein